MRTLTVPEVEELLSTAHGNVSYVSQYARTTATVTDGRWTRKQFAYDYLRDLKEAERKAAYVAPVRPVATGKRALAYIGPFPRGKHSHKCLGCAEVSGQYNGVACYKSKCTKPHTVATCEWCERKFQGVK